MEIGDPKQFCDTCHGSWEIPISEGVTVTAFHCTAYLLHASFISQLGVLPLAPDINIAQPLQSRPSHWSPFYLVSCILSFFSFLSGLRDVVLNDELLLPPLLPRLLLRQGGNLHGLAMGVHLHETWQLDLLQKGWKHRDSNTKYLRFQTFSQSFPTRCINSPVCTGL